MTESASPPRTPAARAPHANGKNTIGENNGQEN